MLIKIALSLVSGNNTSIFLFHHVCFDLQPIKKKKRKKFIDIDPSSSSSGFRIKKDTFIFLNNYDLNMSTDLWTSPEEFIPDRFVQNGRLLKPEHFLPFGGGRRSCMGYKLVQYVSFAILASILKNFTITPVQKEDYTIPIGNLALPEMTYKFRFERR